MIFKQRRIGDDRRGRARRVCWYRGCEMIFKQRRIGDDSKLIVVVEQI